MHVVVVVEIQMFWLNKVIRVIVYLLDIILHFVRKEMLQGPR